MSVSIVGTLEMIYTSGGETVSEAVHVDFASPTEAPLPLHESLVFPDRTPPVDIRIPLEAHLEDEGAHGFTDVARVASPRAGALAEWTAVRPDSVAAEIVLWDAVPLVQEGIDWGATVTSDTGAEWAYQTIAIGEGAEATGEASIAVGYNAKSTEESSTAMGHDARATGEQSLAVGRDSNAGADRSTATGNNARATGYRSTATGNNARADGAYSIATGYNAQATGDRSTATGGNAQATGASNTATGGFAQATGDRSTATGYFAQAHGDRSTATGFNAHAASGYSIATGNNAAVHATSPRSIAIGGYANVPASSPDITVIATKSLQLSPHADADTAASTITLYDAAGNPHTVGVTANGLIVNGSPVGVGMPPPARGFQNLSQTRTTAGDIDFTSATATVTGLQPNTDYTCRVDVFVWARTASTGQFRPQIKYPTDGGSSFSQVESLTLDIRNYTWTLITTRTSNASGVITAIPSMQWSTGSITSSRGEAILTVNGPA